MEATKKRYFIELCYDGSAFSGWQKQQNAASVQETLEKALSLILGEEISAVGCGRTDTGVHAKSFFAHFDTELAIQTNQLTFKLNSLLKNSIGIFRILEVENDLHARFSALERTYKYQLLFKKIPFELPFSHYIYGKRPDVEKMNDAAHKLIGTHNFSCFEKIGSDNSTSICTLTKAEWSLTKNGAVFEIKANRFLRNMVRAIVGTLLELGLGEIDHKEFDKILKSEDRSIAGPSAPAKGLFLYDITYPKLKSYE